VKTSREKRTLPPTPSPTTNPATPGVSVARALGSSTRAGIFEHLRAAGTGLTVRDVASTFDLHPNVARTHLELLAEAGLLSIGRRKHPGGGRPAKVYVARDEVDAHAQLDVAAAARGGPAAALVVRLLMTLLDDRGPGGVLAARAHEAALAEGRRLVAGVPRPADVPGAGKVEVAARVAIRALRAHAPEARLLRASADWADVAGLGGLVGLVERVDPILAEVLERGLLAGAFAGAGLPVTLAEAAAPQGGGRTWRAVAAVPSGTRAAATPSGTVDARGQQRETGVVRAMRAVTSLRTGEVLEVLAEGPGSPAAFARWADRAGHQLLGVERATDAVGRPAIRLLIRKGA